MSHNWKENYTKNTIFDRLYHFLWDKSDIINEESKSSILGKINLPHTILFMHK